MTVIEIDLKKYLTTTFYDPCPDRFDSKEPSISERRIPLQYTCENCREKINFSTESFERHCNSEFSNLKRAENKLFDDFRKRKDLIDFSFLDFYCPKCNQPTKFIFKGGPSGYWGMFFFEIEKVIVLK